MRPYNCFDLIVILKTIQLYSNYLHKISSTVLSTSSCLLRPVIVLLFFIALRGPMFFDGNENPRHSLYAYSRSNYQFLTNWLHSLMWLIVSFQFPHNLLLLFCCVLSILASIWLVFMALFCAAIRRDSVSLLKFLFLSHIHVFSC